MHNDLKILFWLFLITLMVFAIYSVVDYTFDALDNPSNYSYYKTIRSSYTDQPSDFDPDVKPDTKWQPRRESLPFMGYAHQSVIIMISGIIVVAFLGFLVLYIINYKDRE